MQHRGRHVEADAAQRALAVPARRQGHDHEQQADQGAGRRADGQIEILPPTEHRGALQRLRARMSAISFWFIASSAALISSAAIGIEKSSKRLPCLKAVTLRAS